MPFDDRSTNLDLNGPNIEIKTDAYGHEEGSTTSKTTVNPFGADASRTGGTLEITGVGTASWPTGFSTYASNTGTIGYQWYKLNIAGVGEPLGISTRYEGQTTDTLKLKYLDNPADNEKQYYVKTRILPSAYAQPEGSTVTAGTARSTGFAINEEIDSSTVTVTVLPELTLDTQPTNQSATINNNAEFNTLASVTDDSIVSYQWYVDGNKVSDGDLTSTNFASVNKVKYSVDSPNGRDNSITIPEDATNVKIRVGAGAGGYGGTDTNGQGGSGGYGRVGNFTLPDGGRTLTIRTGTRGSNANSGNNAQGGNGGQVTDDGDGAAGGDAPDSGAGGGGASGCYVYDSLTGGWIIAAGGGGGGGGGSWNVAGNAGANGGDWAGLPGSLDRNLQSNGSRGESRSTSTTNTRGPNDTTVTFSAKLNKNYWGQSNHAIHAVLQNGTGSRGLDTTLPPVSAGWPDREHFNSTEEFTTLEYNYDFGQNLNVWIDGPDGSKTSRDGSRSPRNSINWIQFGNNFKTLYFWIGGGGMPEDGSAGKSNLFPTITITCDAGTWTTRDGNTSSSGELYDMGNPGSIPLEEYKTYLYQPWKGGGLLTPSTIIWSAGAAQSIRQDGGGGGGGGGG